MSFNDRSLKDDSSMSKVANDSVIGRDADIRRLDDKSFERERKPLGLFLMILLFFTFNFVYSDWDFLIKTVLADLIVIIRNGVILEPI